MSRNPRRLVVCVLLAAVSAGAQSVRVIRFSEGKPFQMGEVTSMRIVHPGIGAKQTTLNYSVSRPGNEFAQHVHDGSDDTILVLQGEVDLRQGDSRRRFREGECAFVPAGQIHGTITAGTGETIMISFQNPPDLVLYTGARDSKKTGESPKGVITPGAVKYLKYSDKNGLVTSPQMGSHRAAFAHRKLKVGESLRASVAAGGEQLVFVKNGSIRVKDDSGATQEAAAKDAVFAQGPVGFEVTATSPGAVVIHVQAPPAAK